jgi:phage terminase large subunit-like protein
MQQLRGKEKVEYEAWLSEKAAIKRAKPTGNEGADVRKKRIDDLLTIGNEPKFARYYFAHLIDSDFAYFHKRDMKRVSEDDDLLALLEYPREHAKSTIFGVIVPMLLIAREDFSGMVCGSANEKKANKLLSDLQSEMMFNERFIADFGVQYNAGKWTEGQFTSKQGYGFWAFGRGQSPRGIKESAYRPKYGLIDDIDDKKLVKNEDLVNEALEWILEDFYGCLPITGSRLIMVGNRIHKKSVLAKFAGDVEPDDPKREGLYHSKVFALEKPKTHQKDLSENGVPAWKERYTREMIVKKMTRMGWRSGLREYFHEHIIEGKVFKEENLPWVDVLPLQAYDLLITYNDPSYKATMTSDCKAIGLIGKKGRNYDIIDIFDNQCTTTEMVRAHYTIAAQIPGHLDVKHYMEANFIQDLMLEEYWRYGEVTGCQLRIRKDRRKKPDKEVRIENLTPFTDMGFIRFNRALKNSPHMQTLRNQFLAFPDRNVHDDGPDMVEGAIWILEKKGGTKKGKNRRGAITGGSFTRNNNNEMY